MEIKKIVCKSGNFYNIVNESWSNSTGWGHKSTLLKGNGYEIDSNKVRYINRTWERYTYESCMNGLIYYILEHNFINYLNQYKEINGITRLKKGQKEEIKTEWEKQIYIQDLMEIKQRISDRNFD